MIFIGLSNRIKVIRKLSYCSLNILLFINYPLHSFHFHQKFYIRKFKLNYLTLKILVIFNRSVKKFIKIILKILS